MPSRTLTQYDRLVSVCETTTELESLDALAIRAMIAWRCECGTVHNDKACAWCGNTDRPKAAA